jgi:hypothetical protein
MVDDAIRFVLDKSNTICCDNEDIQKLHDSINSLSLGY